jgi:predicted PurR-regulated permease PerM
MYSALSKLIQGPNFYRYLIVSGLAFLIVFGLFHYLSGILFPFLAGLLGAYLFNPCVCFLSNYKISRSISASIIVVSFIMLLFFVLSIVLPVLQKEISGFLSQIPDMLRSMDHFMIKTTQKIDHLFSPQDVLAFKQQLASYATNAMKWSANTMINMVGQGLVVANVLSLIIVTPLIMYYLLRDWPLVVNYTIKLLPSCYCQSTLTIFEHIHHVLGSYLRGQGLICIILMILYTSCLFLIGIPQSLLIGFLTGLLSFVPYLGGITGICLSFLLLAPQINAWHLMGKVVLVFGLLTIFEGKILIPRLIGKRVGLHPVWMLFFLFAGAHTFGFLGLIFAIPFAIIISSIIRFSFANSKM